MGEDKVLDTAISVQPAVKPIIEEEEEKEKNEPKTWWNTAYSVGESMLYVADFLGEVFAEFFGMTQSRYQWAVDAYERQQRWEREEKEKEEYHKKLVMDEMRKNKKKLIAAQNDIEIEHGLDQNEIQLSVNRNNEKYERVDINSANDEIQEDHVKEQEEAVELQADMSDNVLTN